MGAGASVLQGEEVPQRPDFQYATELTSESFEELVEQVVNNTAPGKDPPYFPLVMFHVAWCKHCRYALPEFEEAAKLVDDARLGGQLGHLPAPPRFFLIECDSGSVTEVCNKHTGTVYPVIKLFRNSRGVRFNRPRTSRVFAWWSMHAARPMVTELQLADHLYQAGIHSVSFFLKADFKAHKAVLEAWHEVALDFLEEYNFFALRPQTEAGRVIEGPAPAISARGAGLEPLPFHGEFDRDSLSAWVNINRFPPVVELQDWTVGELLACGLPIVAYVHAGSGEGLWEFAEAARDLRTSGKYLFTTVNASHGETRSFVSGKFPLVLSPPRIFVFSGESFYWEDPSLVEPKSLTHERLNNLMSSEEASHDGSISSILKEKRKLMARLATGSFLGAAIVVMVPSLMASCCWLCIRELLRGDDIADDVIKKED